ncbi:VWA domain-containing protein [Bernardetia sp.]|uniref:VWA domain-containing protein n=1 Tax=Bernardetia sp. TaxID=1937974 RepID=UPI0025BCABD7|nr:VWA domain-containing protein [Bernardetia sp.]
MFLTEYSSAWIIVALLLGAGYTALLYHKRSSPWGKTWQKVLAAIRFLWVSVLAILLIGILIQQFVTRYENPTVVFAIDNSSSIALQEDSTKLNNVLNSIQTTAQNLEEKGFDIEYRTLSELKNDSLRENTSNTIDNLNFNFSSSPISELLKSIQSEFENRNLSNVVLLSDGAYNQGLAPDISPYSFSLQTIGVGDTVPKKDIVLKSLFHNKMAYLGNQFPIVAEVTHTGFEAREVTVILSQNGRNISTQKVKFSSNQNDLKSIEFLVKATSKGIQHYVVTVVPQEGEFTTQNNTSHAYIDIIDSKEKILLVAAAPHPDIKAFRAAIEKNENYKFDVYLPYLRPADLEDKYDLIIYHQFPDKIVRPMPILEGLRKRTSAELFIIGAQSDYNLFNSLNTGVKIRPLGNQSDKVIPVWNSNFSKFYLTDEQRSRFADYPPASVPFADYDISPQAEIMLYQRVGNIQTKKPLVVMSENNGRKAGVWLAENTWQWRLGEYAENKNQEGYDALLSKIIQYLSTKEDKRRFRVSPTASQFSTSDNVSFDVEVYNSIYEPLLSQNIRLEIKDEEGKTRTYTFTNNSSPFRYSASALPEGAYSFRATTQLDGKTEVSVGQFTVQEIKLESLNATADFGVMRRLANQNKGNFYTLSNLEVLQDSLENQVPTPTVFRNEQLSDVIHLWWIMLLIIGLASFEWGVRKFQGGY